MPSHQQSPIVTAGRLRKRSRFGAYPHSSEPSGAGTSAMARPYLGCTGAFGISGEMVLDGFDTRRVLGRNPQRTAFLVVFHKTPEMYDAILDDDVFQKHTRPRLRIEFGEKPLTNRAIIKAGRFGNIARRESL